ncbi:MAG TPA: hypothetical protein VMV77_09170 [Bacteroidales bacterium]|nr:hypothetical protein [Bacteroidales bacterium]
MKRVITTVCTADYYQNYIPIFIWSALKTFQGVDIIIYVRGELHDNVLDALKIVNGRYQIVANYKTDYPFLIGTTNALRFTTETIQGYDEVLITDIDFFFSAVSIDIFQFHKDIKVCEFFSGHHGPLHKPHRPNICPAWKGDFERVTGGFVMLYPGWWKKTVEIRKKWDEILHRGKDSKNDIYGQFRESDECILARMIKEAGLPVAPKIPYPRSLRFLHFGDFKPSMKVRYEDKAKMSGFLDRRHVNAFLRALSDPSYSKIVDIVRRNAQMDDIISRTITYCEGVV